MFFRKWKIGLYILLSGELAQEIIKQFFFNPKIYISAALGIINATKA